MEYSDAAMKITRQKCVAVCTLRTGCMRASRTMILISAPEYLHVHIITYKINVHTTPPPIRNWRISIHPIRGVVSRVHAPLRLLTEFTKVPLSKIVRRVTQVHLKHAGPRLLLWQRDVDPLLESTQNTYLQDLTTTYQLTLRILPTSYK